MNTLLFLEVELRREWPNVARAREAVSLLVVGIYGDDDLRDALAMVSAELLENAIKYAAPESRVRLSIQENTDTISVSVTNALAGLDEVENLESRLEWLRAHDDAAAAYTAALARASATPTSGGGLGILRIAYEAGCAIDYDTSHAGQITVRATMAAGRGPTIAGPGPTSGTEVGGASS
jgi:hypothetical protein